MQFTIPQDGIYEFEVWGGAGGAAKVEDIVAEGGLGGHSKGYKKMKKGEVLYVYNGGGATHVATKSGVLGYNSNSNGLNYNNRSSILIVAGGGGGGAIDNGTVHKGGSGGGERGGDGSDGALGGRQISTSSYPSDNFGRAPSTSSSSGTCYAGGGGGWFGGNYGQRGQSGAGGSGYVDGVAPFTHNGKYYPAETEAGVNEGHGKAFIRYVECA